MSPPAHSSANASAERPIAGPSLVQTSTLNGPGAVTAAFGSGSRSHASLDDTIHGYVDLGDISDSDVIFSTMPPILPRGRPCNRGTRRYKEVGPSIQEHIKNFVETDYPEDAGIWKPTATYPEDTVKLHELVFTRSPTSNCADGLLFDPTGMSPWTFLQDVASRLVRPHHG